MSRQKGAWRLEQATQPPICVCALQELAAKETREETAQKGEEKEEEDKEVRGCYLAQRLAPGWA